MNIDFYIPGVGSQVVLYANIDTEYWELSVQSRSDGVELVDKYPPIPGQFVGVSKKCSCFITRIMNREQQTSLLISSSCSRTNTGGGFYCTKISCNFFNLSLDDEELSIIRGKLSIRKEAIKTVWCSPRVLRLWPASQRLLLMINRF